MGLRPSHLGYAYQDLLTAIRLVDVALGRVERVLVDTKLFAGDRFDDLTSEWEGGRRDRIQIKHTDEDRDLSTTTFTQDRRGLQLDLVLGSIDAELTANPETTFRLVVRDTEPRDPDLMAVLRPISDSSDADPGPALPGLSGDRLRFDADALLSLEPWRSRLASVPAETVYRTCGALVVDVGAPECSLDMRAPGPAELVLLRRVADELGAGRPPNRSREPEDVALALIGAAVAARSRKGSVTAQELLPRLDLVVDFGAVTQGQPVDRSVQVLRPTVLDTLAEVLAATAATGGTALLTGPPGSGKTWLCEQLDDRLRPDWLVVRHHCWLGATDTERGRRVLAEVVLGSLLSQLETAAPDSFADLRPRYAATSETLEAVLTAIRRGNPAQPIALIVDGLDHVTRVLGRSGGSAFGSPIDPAASLASELRALSLPDGVALLLASQPGEHVADTNERDYIVTVPPLDRREVEQLAYRLGVLRAAEPQAAEGSVSERARAAVDLIFERSRGNALYATYLCRQAVGAGPSSEVPGESTASDPLDRLSQIPASAHELDDYYAYLLGGLTVDQKHAVALLAVCNFGVSAKELREIFPQAAPLLKAALTAVSPIITQQPGIGGLKIHHESFSRFIRKGADDAEWLAAVRSAAAAWLQGRGFFRDARAFRHLPELLVDLERDDDLVALLGPDLLSRAIESLQPPTAVAHVLNTVARRSADRRDWPTLVRLVELRRAADTYEQDGIPDVVVEYAPLLVELLGADAVAASLIYDGAPTVPARWGLLLCSAVDKAGGAAPWELYLSAFEDARDRDNASYGAELEDEIHLAEQRGRLRVRSDTPAQASADGAPVTDPIDERLAHHLDQSGPRPPLPKLVDVFVDCLGSATVLGAARLMEAPARRAEVILHLADIALDGDDAVPHPGELAAEAWASSPGTAPLSMLQHGLPPAEIAAVTMAAGVDATLGDLTAEVITESGADRPDAVRRWIAAVAVAHAIDPSSPTRLLTRLAGVGFYRAWLRFVVATVGLRRDRETALITPEAASAAARVAIETLASAAQPFTGKPRAVDLWSIHGQIQERLLEALKELQPLDRQPVLNSLNAISRGTTTSLVGMAGSGPLVTTDLLAILSKAWGPDGAAVVRPIMEELRRDHADGDRLYSESAAFELSMARICIDAVDMAEAGRSWQRAARYLGGYGSHKDPTIYELLESVEDLALDPAEARLRLARLQPLTDLVYKHTDGRGTSGIARDWWRSLADVDPEGAAELAGDLLLREPNLEDTRVEAAHVRLLRTQANTADPVVLAVLRVAAGPAGRHVEGDAALLARLNSIGSEDAARTAGVLPVLANAMTAVYDDQPLMHASNAEGPEPTSALEIAAHRLAGEGITPRPPRASESETKTSRPTWSRTSLLSHLVGRQRPNLPPGPPGAIAAARDLDRKRFDDDPEAPRWSPDGAMNAIGWRVVEVAELGGAGAAIALLHQVAGELSPYSDVPILARIAEGLDLRASLHPEVLVKVASAAYALAFTHTRGGGGWRSFAGREGLDLWSRAVELDSMSAADTVAHQVARVVEGRRYGTVGVTQGLIAALASVSPEPDERPLATALACWDAAHEVIAYRLPGSADLGSGQYQPTSSPPSQSAVDTALCKLALAQIALPSRADKRRALVAMVILLAARRGLAQAATASLLRAHLGAGPHSWLLAVLLDGLDGAQLADELEDALRAMAIGEFLSVRALASQVLAASGLLSPDPPATVAPLALTRAVGRALQEEDE